MREEVEDLGNACANSLSSSSSLAVPCTCSARGPLPSVSAWYGRWRRCRCSVAKTRGSGDEKGDRGLRCCEAPVYDGRSRSVDCWLDLVGGSHPHLFSYAADPTFCHLPGTLHHLQAPSATLQAPSTTFPSPSDTFQHLPCCCRGSSLKTLSSSACACGARLCRFKAGRCVCACVRECMFARTRGSLLPHTSGVRVC